MPFTFTRTFRVRYSDCDAYGHLNNANYLRYMQEAAFDASAAAGFGVDRYAQLGCVWLVHRTEIEYLQPLRYNQVVDVKTWVADYQRVSSRRIYEFRLAGEQDLVARAHTDWVLMNTATWRPVTIPSEVKAAYYPEGLPDHFPPHEPFPTAPPPPAGVFSMRLKVAWRDIDTARIVNNPVYLEYIEECGMQVIAAFGWPVTRMMEHGFAIILRRHQIQYLKSACLDDELEVATWASDVRRSSAMRYYTITRISDGALIARVHTLGVWVDLSSGRPIRIPQEFIQEFAPNIVP